MTASPGNPDTKPYGLHRVWITPYLDTDGTILGPVSYRLPIAQTLAFTESEDFDTLAGVTALQFVERPFIDFSRVAVVGLDIGQSGCGSRPGDMPR